MTQKASETPTITDLQILDLLGQGGMARVYKARHLRLDTIVAVKVIAASEASTDGLERFIEEARKTASLEHPNIVKVTKVGLTDSGDPFIVMEYLQGQSLSSLLAKNENIKPEVLGKILDEILKALGYAHSNGLIHRDIKPANIMIMNYESTPEAKLVDFGIAKSIDPKISQKLTATGSLMGTPAYMSPEQCRGLKLDGRSDLYSMACVIYECLFKTMPFPSEDNNSLEMMYKHVNAPPPSVDTMTPVAGKKLATLLASGLAKDPEDRPNNANEFAAQLKKAIAELPSHREQPAKRWTPAVLILSLLLAFSAGGMISWYLKPDPPAPEPDIKRAPDQSLDDLQRKLDLVTEQKDKSRAHALGLIQGRAAEVVLNARKRQWRAHVIAAKAWSTQNLNEQAKAEWQAADSLTSSIWSSGGPEFNETVAGLANELSKTNSCEAASYIAGKIAYLKSHGNSDTKDLDKLLKKLNVSNAKPVVAAETADRKQQRIEWAAQVEDAVALDAKKQYAAARSNWQEADRLAEALWNQGGPEYTQTIGGYAKHLALESDGEAVPYLQGKIDLLQRTTEGQSCSIAALKKVMVEVKAMEKTPSPKA